MRLHREGTPTIIVVTLFCTGLLLATFLKAPAWLLLPVAAACSVLLGIVLWFFRVPARIPVSDDRAIVSPCDGKVVVIEEVNETEYFHGKRLQVSIFMSPLNVHINYHPISGTTSYYKYHPGKYLVAWHPKSSTENERSAVVITTRNGVDVLARQIAGALARRIVTYAKVGDKCHVDEQMGFIKFGSRVDVYLPVGTEVLVEMDQKVTGNQTPIARLGK